MFQKLNLSHQSQILDFCYKRELETQFIINSFKIYKAPFMECYYYGYFEDKILKGLAVYFGAFKSYVVLASEEVNKSLTDLFLKDSLQLDYIVNFKKYADVTLRYLKDTYVKVPKNTELEDVFRLSKSNFIYNSKTSAQKATNEDLDNIINLQEGISLEDITDEDRKKITIQNDYILKKDNKIVSRAYVQGESKNYFQIGGVITHPAYRRQGLSRQVLNTLIQDKFKNGAKYALLFTGRNNIPARKLYFSLGFTIIDELILATF